MIRLLAIGALVFVTAASYALFTPAHIALPVTSTAAAPDTLYLETRHAMRDWPLTDSDPGIWSVEIHNGAAHRTLVLDCIAQRYRPRWADSTAAASWQPARGAWGEFFMREVCET